MDEQRIVSDSRLFRRRSPSSAWRAGIAKDQLIFIIICSAAAAVAAVSLVVSMSDKPPPTVQWQCISCNYEFSNRSVERPPIECPKCGEQAAKLTYRPCPKCGKSVLTARSRLTTQGQARRDASSGGRAAGRLPMETQFWIKQADGTYKWSEWIPASAPQLRKQYASRLQCPEDGTSLSSRSIRKQR